MRGPVRLLVVVLAVLAGVPLLAAALLALLANVEPGRHLIESAVARLSGERVVLEGMAGRFPDRLRLARLRLRDPQGQWLEIDAARLDWSPRQLLAARLGVEDIEADRVALERAPAYPHKPHPPSQLPLWLRHLHLDLKRLLVRRCELGAPLAGQPVALQVQGVARLRSLAHLDLQLDARRLDAVPSVYHLVAAMRGTQFQGQLDLQEGAGGPLSHLIHLPDLGSIAVHGRLLGPMSALQTDLDAQAGTLRAEAHGRLDVPARSAQLEVAADSGAMTPRPGLRWGRIVLRGQARGALLGPTTQATLDAQQIGIGPFQIGDLNVTLHGEGAALDLAGTVAGFILPGPVHGMLQQTPVSAEAQLRLGGGRRELEVSVSHPLVHGHGSYVFDRARSGAFTAEVTDLLPVSRMIGLRIAGTGQVRGQLHAAEGGERMILDSTLQVSGGAAPVAGLLQPQSRLSTTLLLGGGGAVIEDARLSTPSASARGAGRAFRDGIDVRWSASVTNLAAASPVLAGTLVSQGRVLGRAPRLGLDLDARGTVSAHGTVPGALRLSMRGRDVPERPSVRADLSGQLDAAPVQLAFTAERRAGGGFEVQVPHGEWKSFRADGTLVAGADGRSPRGQVRLQIGRLADLDRVLGRPLQGSLSARFDAVSARGEPGVHIAVEAQRFGTPTAQLQQLRVQGEASDLLHTPRLSLEVTGSAVRDDVAAQLAAQARGPWNELQLRVDAQGRRGSGPPVRLQGGATWLQATRTLRLSGLTVAYERQQLRLLAPANLDFRDGLDVDELALGLDSAVLHARGRLLPNLDLQASLHHFTPELVRALVPDLDAEGTVDAAVSLQGPWSGPSGTAQLDAVRFRARSGALRGLPATDLHAQAHLEGRRAEVQLRLDAGTQLQLQVAGQVPFGQTEPVALHLEGHGNLAAANPVLGASGQRLLGQARIDASLRGTLAAPQPQGTLTLVDVDLQDYSRGVHLTHIDATVQGDGERLVLRQFGAHAGSGTVAASGQIGFDGDGRMPVNLTFTARDAQAFTSDLLNANVDLDLHVSGDLRHAWSEHSTLRATGTVHVNRAEIHVPNALPPNVEVLDVVRPGQTPQDLARTHALHIGTDVTVDAPRAVFVRGRGVDAELGGSLHVGGMSTEPAITGALTMRTGTVTLAGANLAFSNTSSVSFNGSGVRHRIDPTLDFEATRLSGNIRSTLSITGYADAPVIRLSSQPDMPQDEILAQLLFGESVTQLSALQAAQIGAALASMSGIGGGGSFNPIEAIQRKLGLDRLAISGAGNAAGGAAGGSSAAGASGAAAAAATIEAGRYVSNRIYLGARQSTTGLTQGQVQIDLTRRLKIQATLGTGGATSVQGATPQNDPGSSVGFSYQLEY